MKIYVDSEYHCHVTNPNGAFREIENDFFNGMCRTAVEGYCYDDSKGYVQIYPWKLNDQLEAAQAQYEIDLAEAADAYQEGVNSAYDN